MGPTTTRAQLRVGEAKEEARAWVEQSASHLPGFEGAFFHGSITELANTEILPFTSDVDIGVVRSNSQSVPERGKFRHHGLLLEAATIPAERVAAPEQVLGDFQLAHSFRVDGVIADPTGHLASLQSGVEPQFAEPRWVLERCRHVRSKCLDYGALLSKSTALHHQAICWLFGQSTVSLLLLVAGLRNPTVRRRYSTTRALLGDIERLEVQETLLQQMGCAEIQRSRVEHHLSAMTRCFDEACDVLRSEFPFGPDIQSTSRPLAVEGSLSLIRQGEHREAVFWIAVTLARSLAVLEQDGDSQTAQECETALRELLNDLGLRGLRSMSDSAARIPDHLSMLEPIVADLVSRGNA